MVEVFIIKSVDWGASAKQQSTLTDNTSVDEAFMGYKLSKTLQFLLVNKIPLSFAESTSSMTYLLLKEPHQLMQ